ncbi:MAG TPA: vitamin K epoxide reductase family protein [Gaiellaceae bacterium]
MSERRLRIAIGMLSALGAGIAGYLAVVKLSGGSPVCSTGGCDTVQSSRYSELLGVPVAVLGLVGYLVILGTALARGELARTVGAVAGVAGAAFAAYLLCLQLGPIGAVCQWCVASDVVIAALAVLTFIRASRAPVPGPPAAPRAAGRRGRAPRPAARAR